MKFVSPILGVFVISEILVVLMVECRWLFDSLSKCEWVMSCEVLAEKLSAVICLVVFGRVLFQLFLEKGCFPFFEDEVNGFVKHKSEEKIRIYLLLMMVITNALSPFFLSLACWRLFGTFNAPMLIVLAVSWIVMSLLEGQVYKSSLRLRIIKPRARTMTARQLMRGCSVFCYRLTAREVIVIATTMILSFGIGYLVSYFSERQRLPLVVDVGSRWPGTDSGMILERRSENHGRLRHESLGNSRMHVVDAQRRSTNISDRLSPAKGLMVASKSSHASLIEHQTNSIVDAAQYASDLNDVMDEMLNRSEIPADYAETMVALFRDKSQGDVIRDFAVQHIGLYAETLKMRGKYDADSAESAALRDALWDAAEETRTIVAVAAFRALADMAAFDPRVDAKRLDSRLASCVADLSASPAARVMAAQLCGERGVAAAKPALARIAADSRAPEPLRRAAANSAKLLAE